MKTVRIRCLGRVQGVFFRKYTQDKARELNIKGFVKNEADGSVLIFACGEDSRVDRLIEWCHEGPPSARVDNVVNERLGEKEITGYEGFEIVH